MKRVLITCGPTWVPIDDVRVISNTSTGELGHILAQDFNRAGARVTLLEGPVLRPLVSKAKRIKVKKFCFYQELYDLLKKELRLKYDIVVHAAAVSDYRLKKSCAAKLRSGQKGIKLSLVPTEKIINRIKKWSTKSFLVGFKLESTTNEKALKSAAVNLINKAKCDLVVANSAGAGLPRPYKACIVDQEQHIIARARSRAGLSRKLVGVLL